MVRVCVCVRVVWERVCDIVVCNIWCWSSPEYYAAVLAINKCDSSSSSKVFLRSAAHHVMRPVVHGAVTQPKAFNGNNSATYGGKVFCLLLFFLFFFCLIRNLNNTKHKRWTICRRCYVSYRNFPFYAVGSGNFSSPLSHVSSCHSHRDCSRNLIRCTGVENDE